MSERVAVVTGAAGGIGTAVVRLFARHGWSVVGIDRNKPPAELEMDRFVQVDIGDGAAAEEALAGLSDLGRVDALVNNAAVNVVRRLVDTTMDEWEHVMGVNVRAAQQAMRCLCPLLADHGAAIVNISSVHALATSPDMSTYAASKGALLALTRAAALEFAQRRIRVNAVVPGAVDTPMLRLGLERRPADVTEMQALGDLARRTPLGRIGRPEDIAEVVLFLADGARSGFVTGQAIVADGGATARLSTE